MSSRVSMANLGEIITLQNNQNKKFNSKSATSNLLDFAFEESIISDDINLLRWQVTSKEDVELFGSFDLDALSIKIPLSGAINNYSNHNNTTINIKPNEIATAYTKSVAGYEFYKKDVQYKSLVIILKNSFLEKYSPILLERFNKVQDKDFFQILKQKKIPYSTLATANELFHFPIEKELDIIKIQGLIFDIIYSELNDLLDKTDEKKENQVKFSQYDLNALNEAKNILINNLQTPPTIVELSKMVKLNEFKLKYGFKNFFNATPYSIVFDYRMEKAKKLLQGSDYNINEISSMVGYRQSSNFSKAFFKKFGILPKEIMKGRKYYY